MIEQKRNNRLMPIAFSIIFLLGLILGYFLNNNGTSTGFLSGKRNSALQEISNLIKNKYVDEINIDSINAAVVEDVLARLDPHSIYISPSDLEQVNNQMEGHFIGIGVIYDNIDDTLTILKIVKDGPAEKSGLQIGDKILVANDTFNLLGVKTNDANIKKNLRGVSGSILKLKVLRNGLEKNISMKRKAISIPSVDAAYIIKPKTGYIKINKFAERTYEEFMQNLERLQKEKIENLILDLRGNGGGFMHAATLIADEFLDGDKLIVYTQGNKYEKFEFRCKKEGLFEKGKLTVLIDETSASASEVLAGALQDWDRAIIVGRRSFGKGLVQQQFNLSDGGALRLTIAKYYTPLGRNIQKSYSSGKEKYSHDIEERYHSGELTKGDSIIKNGKSFKTPKGNIVYAGGGINPDYFVGFDTTKLFCYKQNFSDIIDKFIHKYYMQNKSSFVNLKTVAAIDSKISLTELDWNLLNKIAVRDSIDISNFSSTNKDFILQILKANIAKFIIDDNSYYQIINSTDKSILKAIELLN